MNRPGWGGETIALRMKAMFGKKGGDILWGEGICSPNPARRHSQGVLERVNFPSFGGEIIQAEERFNQLLVEREEKRKEEGSTVTKKVRTFVRAGEPYRRKDSFFPSSCLRGGRGKEKGAAPLFVFRGKKRPIRE